MTEDQAKEKWCPMVRHQSDADQSSSNRFGVYESDNWNACIASDCMMWKWDYEHSAAIDSPRTSDTNGHCGLTRGQ